MTKALITGVAGFLGSHLADELINQGYEVVGIDNLLTGNKDNINSRVQFHQKNISVFGQINSCFEGVDIVFHCAAIARTPWTIEDPLLCNDVNVTGTLNVLEASRRNNVKRVVLSSSCIVYAAPTPYKVSKETLEAYGQLYNECYGLSVIALRYSNLYGTRQSEEGISPNVFASLRKSKKETGKIFLTGDGEQTRDYMHVSDCVKGNILASQSKFCGSIDLCTGIQTSLNEVAKYFDCPIEYVPDRPGDVKQIIQNPRFAKDILNFKSTTKLEDYIREVL